jgi:branched-chain amino acid aminotransferase
MHRLLVVNKLKDAYIRLTVTRGMGRVGLDATTAKGCSIAAVTKKFEPYPDKFYKKGITLRTSSVRRDEKSPHSGLKTLNYLSNILARMEAQRAGADDALMLNTRREVAETAVSNIFMVKGRDLITPSADSGILPGITREIVLNLADRAGLRHIERHLKPDELKKAKEVFLTNTLMEVMPVAKIDDKKIGAGRPGPVTKRLHKLYTEEVRSYK